MFSHLAQRTGHDESIFIIFIVILSAFLIADLVILQRSDKATSLKSAVIQTLCWVSISLIFCAVLFFYRGHESAAQYLSAYVMEYALSADNIFVFILILNYFNLSEKYYHKVLFYGIGTAIVLRLIFILVGITLVNNFHWVLYIFGAIIIYTGVRMFFSKGENEFDPKKNYAYRFLNKYLDFTNDEGNGKLRVKREGVNYFTLLFLVIAIIGFTDLVFALDSIPAVFAISQSKLIIITSNVFAVMGLRAMFFLLHDIVKKFSYLHEGISIVLVFIGLKMLLQIVHVNIATPLSLLIIVTVLLASIAYSFLQKNGDNSAR
jgi:tellurite resistance protein TerC